MEITLIHAEHYHSAYNVLVQLRDNISFNEFKKSLYVQELIGYKLYGMIENGSVVGLIGFRPVHSFVRGLYVEVDDLVVDDAHRKKHIGEKLITFASEFAKERKADFLVLNARKGAVDFYEKLGFTMHGSPSMKMDLWG